ncbi:efflux RND transporter periplasmic adaptor subunit [Halomonas sp. E14]|uniref:efflux RND transporter periplasmic adaptor subunit n=1 Tax=Halomonas sp. E14 TaxID=3397245 RepID=UPI00403EA622
MPRRPPLSYLLAAAVLLALLLWLLLGDMQRFQATAPAPQAPPTEALPRVEYRLSEAQPYTPRLVTQGHLRALREVELRTRSDGRVTGLPARQGARVAGGETLLVLSPDALEAQLSRAEDQLALARAELAGADDLRRRNLLSQPELLRLQASASQAAAEVAQLRHALAETRPSAPFDGVLDRLDVELGDVLQSGETFGRLLDDRRLTASAWVAQRDALALAPGQAVEVRLLNGEPLSGELVHVASRADDATRSFHVEAELDNPERLRLAGASATLAIALPQRRVHALSPALLELNDEGQLQVKHLDAEDRVVRSPVSLVDADARTARVAGLPETIRLITLGGGFVTAGDAVIAVAAEAPEATSPSEASP